MRRGPDGRATWSRARLGWCGPWLAPFPLAAGLYALALCAFLAATYLAVEAEGDPELQWDFRLRAFAAGVAVGAARWRAFLLSAEGAPPFIRACLDRRVDLAAARRDRRWPPCGPGRARPASLPVGARGGRRAVALVILGWVASQYPFLLVPDLTLAAASAPRETQMLLLATLGAGAPVLFPSLVLLFRVFKARPR